MKKVVLFISLSILFSACPPLPKHMYEKVEYKAISRGFVETITVEVSSSKVLISIVKNSTQETTRRLTNKESLELFDLLRYVQLDTIGKLEAPSKRHQFDAAPIASLQITTKDNSYKSVSFDHGNPPVELKPLITFLQKLAQ